MERASLGKILAVIGALLALLSGLYSVFADKPLIAALTNGAILGGLGGSQLDVMGVVGVFGGILALASAVAGLWLGVVVGGILGLIAPCGLAILAIIGGILMKK